RSDGDAELGRLDREEDADADQSAEQHRADDDDEPGVTHPDRAQASVHHFFDRDEIDTARGDDSIALFLLRRFLHVPAPTKQLPQPGKSGQFQDLEAASEHFVNNITAAYGRLPDRGDG